MCYAFGGMAIEEHIRGLFAGVRSGYETHRGVLCEAVLRTQGPILELGAGDGSTLALHGVALATGRRVWTFDQDPAWVARFMSLRSELHFIAHVRDWDACPLEAQFWSVAFVDHAPADRRVIDIRRLAYHAELVVVHDTESAEYGYEAIADCFAYRWDYREHPQWSTVFSNYVDVSAWQLTG
jgi:hypothetical protein